MEKERLFRIGDTPGYHDGGIPWAMMEPHAKQARRNHDQSLERLHERGGLSWGEALAVLQNRDWKSEPDAKRLVLDMVARWKRDNAKPVLDQGDG